MLTARAELSLVLLCLLVLPGTAGADVIVSEGTNINIDVASDGRLAMDLLGSLWLVPKDGGETVAISGNRRLAKRPRWSPNDDALLYQSQAADKHSIWLFEFTSGQSTPLADTRYSNQQPDWHPDGERVVYASARGNSGFDIWETDIPTGLSWRLTGLAGHETEPAWSADGRHLVYIHQHDGLWSLMLRRHGRADEAVLSSLYPLAAPSWRPDGSLISYLRRGDDGWAVWMTILSEPRLHRTMQAREDFFLGPVAWRDRHQLYYAADGQIKTRHFDAWQSTTVPFRARIGQAAAIATAKTRTRDLPDITPPDGRTIIRAGRVFDGVNSAYVENPDIVIDGASITAIETQHSRTDGIVVDLGDLTVIPGLIDAYASLPANTSASVGPLLLALGVTTLVADHPDSTALNATWSGKAMPGPRLLAARTHDRAADSKELPWLVTLSGDLNTGVLHKAAVAKWRAQGVAVLADNWQLALGSGANLLLGSDSGPMSPAGRRYADVRLASGSSEITLVSSIADAATPGVTNIWRSRVASLLAPQRLPVQRFSGLPDLSAAAPTVVAGSYLNALPPAVALHAELRALVNAGLSAEQALKAAGVNAASALGVGLTLGRIAPGAAADLLIVDGDPLSRVDDALNIVGVVRNGRFYSVSGLIDRAQAAPTVE